MVLFFLIKWFYILLLTNNKDNFLFCFYLFILIVVGQIWQIKYSKIDSNSFQWSTIIVAIIILTRGYILIIVYSFWNEDIDKIKIQMEISSYK